MEQKTKKTIREYAIFLGVIMVLYLTGLHTEVFGFLQRGILATGLLNPDTESIERESSTLPDADFNFSLRNSKGETVDMQDLKGKVIFMNIWATWCPPCIAEMPAINKLYEKTKNDNVIFVMISVDEDFQKAVQFRERKGYEFEVYSLVTNMPPMYHSSNIPTTFVIDSKGKLAMVHKGMSNYNSDKFLAYIQSLKN